jgi:hypothetical protein
MAHSFRSIALCAYSNRGLVTGLCASSSTAYQPACFSHIQCRTRSPFATPAVVATWSTKRPIRWPNANKRQPLRWRARYSQVWNCVRSALQTGDALATSCFGNLVRAWRRQLPKRAPGKRGRILVVVLSQPSVSMPRTQ